MEQNLKLNLNLKNFAKFQIFNVYKFLVHVNRI